MTTQSKTFPRDVFLYLLSIIALVTVAVSFGVLLYKYIEIQFPDLLTEGYYWSKTSALDSIRNSMAILIVVFPVFIWVSWFLAKDMHKFPEKRDLRIRRWLLYLTLFAASLVIIGDLIALLMSFLNGELTTRFILKVLTVLLIAGSILAHYFSELRDKAFGWMGVLDKVLIVLVAAGVLGGFWIAGSPAQQRAVRFDERRITDLSTIQYQVIDYWQRKQALPSNLMDLKNDISGFVAPKDPETGADYAYRVTGPQSFEICGVFATANNDGRSPNQDYSMARYPGETFDNWMHEAGEACFDRKIDPDYYPPIKDGLVPRPI